MKTSYSYLFIALFIFIISSCAKRDVPDPNPKVSWVKVQLHDVPPLNGQQWVFVEFQNFYVVDPYSYNGNPPIENYGFLYLENVQGDTSAVATVTAEKSMIAGLGANSGSSGPGGTPFAFKNIISPSTDTLEISFDY